MIQKNRTYVEIYHSLINELQGEIPLNLFFKSFGFAGVIALGGYVFSEQHLGESLIGVIFGMIVTAFIVISIIWHILGVWHSIGVAESKTRQIVATLLLKTVKPYKPQESGLSFEEVESIRKIAEAHQGSADWRGNVINLLNIFVVTVLFNVLIVINQYFASKSMNGLFLSSMADADIEWLSEVNRIWLSVVAVAVILFLFMRFYTYYRSFLQAEVPNRAIIYGCIEAEALLKHFNLERVSEYSIEQKIMLAKALNCVSVENPYGKNAYLFAESNKYWYLEDAPIGAKLISNVQLKVKSLSIPSPARFLRGRWESIKAKYQSLKSAYSTRNKKDKGKKITRRRK